MGITGALPLSDAVLKLQKSISTVQQGGLSIKLYL